MRIETTYPYTRGKVFRLGEPFNQDIPDPFKQSAEVFRTSFELINRGCHVWLKKLTVLANQGYIKYESSCSTTGRRGRRR